MLRVHSALSLVQVTHVLTAIGIMPEERTLFERSTDGATRNATVQRGNSFHVSPWLDSTQALAACHAPTEDTPTAATSTPTEDTQAAGSDAELDLGIEVVDHGSSAPAAAPLSTEVESQSTTSETKDEGTLRQRTRPERQGEESSTPSLNKGIKQVAAEALQEELKCVCTCFETIVRFLVC